MKKLIIFVKYFKFIALLCLSGCQSPTSQEEMVANSFVTTNSELPKDLEREATPKEAAEFAWNCFLAINQDNMDGSGTEWEGYKEAFDIFLPKATAPTAWGEPTPSNNPPCQSSISQYKVLRTTSKVSPVLNETDQAVGGVLIDRNSNLVHYEVYLNKTMFKYVLDSQIYNAITQAGSDVIFPNGSMELKAAWRILDPAVDDISRYHTAEAIIYLPDSTHVRNDDCLPLEVKNKLEVCSQNLVGLVGLHVVYKTLSNPNFIWMTFEQIDNVEIQFGDSQVSPIKPTKPPDPRHPKIPKITLASFRNDAKKIPECPDNSRQCNCPKQTASQITRQNPIPDWVQKVNQSKQDSLHCANSIWRYYQLIGIQWAQDDTRTGNPLLVNLANTTMETFNQTASSCIGCHAFARSTNPTVYSDFSWVMGRAQNPIAELPDTTGSAVLRHIMRENSYKNWGTWPNSKWNTYNTARSGENPHGNSVRIYVNDVALKYYNRTKDILIENPQLPVGSIVMKENLRTEQPAVPKPSDLVELTVMYKAEDSQGKSRWFWMKTRPYGPIASAGFNQSACISCHMNWKGNGDGMLSFNFGKRPVITKEPYSPSYHSSDKVYSPKEFEALEKYLKALTSFPNP